MNNSVDPREILKVISARRSIKPDRMNGKQIPDETILQLLELADSAPTHARTEPWRFIVYSGGKVKEFTRQHADLYKQHTPEASFTPQKYQNLDRLGENVSHIVIVWMRREPNHKIPEVEEIAATAAAIQNILIGATANGIASFWSTGGLTHHPAMSEELKLGSEDIVMAILYLGYTDDNFTTPKRLIPLENKMEWIK